VQFGSLRFYCTRNPDRINIILFLLKQCLLTRLPTKMVCMSFQQIPQYSYLTEFNIFGTMRRMSFRENHKIQKKDKRRRACLLTLGKDSLQNKYS